MGWLTYKFSLPIEKIQRLCDLAKELDEAKEVVQDSIGSGYVYPEDFVRMKDLFERLVHSLIAVVRSFAGSKFEDEIKKLEKELIVLIQWTEKDNISIINELKGNKRDYASMSMYLSRVNKLLYALFAGALDDTLSYNKKTVMKHFIISIYQRCGITPSPNFLKEMEEKSKTIEAGE